jgi:hypothetical protein
VLYKPPLKGSTALLVALGLALGWRTISRQGAKPDS